jgi:hypothetical protein
MFIGCKEKALSLHRSDMLFVVMHMRLLTEPLRCGCCDYKHLAPLERNHGRAKWTLPNDRSRPSPLRGSVPASTQTSSAL